MTMPTTVPTNAPTNASPPWAASVPTRAAAAPSPLPADSAQPFIFRRLLTPELIDAKGLLSERGCITLCESARIELQAHIGWFSHKFLAQSQLNVVLARLSAARAIGAEATVDATAAATADATAAATAAGATANASAHGEIVGAAAPRLFEYVWLVVWISKLSVGSIALTHEIYGVSGALYYRQRIMEGCFHVGLQQVAPLTAEMLACGAQALLPRNWSMSPDLFARCAVPTPAKSAASALMLLLAPQALPLNKAPVAPHAAGAAFVYRARINYSQTQCRHSQLYEANLPLLCEQAWCYYLSAQGLLPQPGTPCPWRVTELTGTIHQLPRISQVVTIALAPPVLPVAPLKPQPAAAAVALSWQLWCEDGTLSYEQQAHFELSAPLLAALSAVRSRADES